MDKIGSLLECSVCLEPLGTNHKVLPCQHTFCLPCLQDVWEGHKTRTAARQASSSSSSSSPLCPECRRACPVADPKCLPTNVILNRLLEGIHGMHVHEAPKTATTSVTSSSLSNANNNGDEETTKQNTSKSDNQSIRGLVAFGSSPSVM